METKGKLGLGSGISVAVGLIVATSCLLSLGSGIGLAGPMFILPLFVVLILNSFIAISFAELNRMMPDIDGGVGQYMLVGLGPLASIVSNTSAYVITEMLSASVELSMCGLIIHQLIPQIPAMIVSLALLAILFGVNYFGVDMFAKIQNIVVILLLGSMLLLGLISVLHLGTGHIISSAVQDKPQISGIGGVMGLSATAFWLFIGVEFVIPVSKELKNPKRNVILSMIFGLGILFVLQSILGIGMTQYVKLSQLAGSDTPHMIFATNLLGHAGSVWMGLVTVLAGISTLNTILPSTSKIMQGMAEEGMYPKIFEKTNRHGVALAGMCLMCGVIALILVTGYASSSGLSNMILAASCFWLVSYALTHLNVIVLRKRYPEAPRNEKLRFANIPQIFGIIGIIYMIWNISSDMESRLMIYRLFFIIFALLVVVAFCWVKFVMKVKPFKAVPIEEVSKEAYRWRKEASKPEYIYSREQTV